MVSSLNSSEMLPQINKIYAEALGLLVFDISSYDIHEKGSIILKVSFEYMIHTKGNRRCNLIILKCFMRLMFI